MWLSNRQRFAVLAKHLVQQPRYLPAYLRHLPCWKKSPLDLALPWWPYAAIERCAQLVTPASRVFEFGSGGSTLFLARRAGNVACLEDSPGWCEAVRAALGRIGAAHVMVHEATLPQGPKDNDAWQTYLTPMQGQYDLIVVDGQDEGMAFGRPGSMRDRCFLHSENFIKPGGVILVDDSWRYPHLRTASRARRVETLASVGPCRYGVTTSDLYYY